MREGGVTPQLTHSEYLKDILSSSNSAIITFILNSAITGKSVEGFKNNFKYSFYIPLIYDTFLKEISSSGDPDPLVKYAFCMFILALIAMSCFLSILYNLLCLYLINKQDILNKYPRLGKYVKLYEKTSLIFILLEGLTCFTVLIFIMGINLFLAGIIKFK